MKECVYNDIDDENYCYRLGTKCNGDIVKASNYSRPLKVKYSSKNAAFMLEGLCDYYFTELTDLEVIGNVFQYKELLKEGIT